LYLLRKWRTMSETVPPPMTTLTLALTNFWTNFSASYSSPRL
jgi:hypothetical protein